MNPCEQSDLVLNDTKVFRKLRRHLEAERRSAVAARVTWQQLEEAVTLLRRTAAQVRPALTLDITVDAVGKLLDLRRELRPDALEREIDRVENDVRASVRRLQDLVVHAQSAEAIAEIERMARASGFGGCSAQPQYHAGQKLVGWRLNLEKTLMNPTPDLYSACPLGSARLGCVGSHLGLDDHAGRDELCEHAAELRRVDARVARERVAEREHPLPEHPLDRRIGRAERDLAAVEDGGDSRCRAARPARGARPNTRTAAAARASRSLPVRWPGRAGGSARRWRRRAR